MLEALTYKTFNQDLYIKEAIEYGSIDQLEQFAVQLKSFTKKIRQQEDLFSAFFNKDVLGDMFYNALTYYESQCYEHIPKLVQVALDYEDATEVVKHYEEAPEGSLGEADLKNFEIIKAKQLSLKESLDQQVKAINDRRTAMYQHWKRKGDEFFSSPID